MFITGVYFGSVLIPEIFTRLEFRLMTTAEKQRALQDEIERREIKNVKKSKVFKDRLQSILKSIEDATREKRNSLTVAYFSNCKTDNAIRQELERRKFDTRTSWEDKNSMTILWQL